MISPLQSLETMKTMKMMSDYREDEEPKLQWHMSKKPKLVQFDTESFPNQIRYIAAGSEEEIQEQWYTKSDYKRFKSSIRTVLRHMIGKGENDTSENDCCTRGLELMTPAENQQLDQVRRRMLAAVWNGQVRQWNEKDTIYDPEAIARACQKETQNSARVARSFGIGDELALRQDCSSTKTSLSVMSLTPLDNRSRRSCLRASAA